MVNWFRGKNPVTENHLIYPKSGILSKWANKLKEIKKTKRKEQQPIAATPCRRTATTTPLPSIVSTRGHFSLLTGQPIFLHNEIDLNNYHMTKVSRNCYLDGGELVMYIHGVWVDQYSAKEQIDRTKLSLTANGCHIPITGFSWDSNTSPNPTGWGIAKSIASQNGIKLAKFISDFKTVHQDVNIRIIAHSLGAKVVESALMALDKNNKGTRNRHIPHYHIASIHLMGAAINDASASKNTAFGCSIENNVYRFYNLYNPEDNALKRAYVNTENQNPLGLYGIRKGEPSPANYVERNVKFEIPPLKRASGLYQSFCDRAVYGWGDNHCGYIGFREPYPFNRFLKDDGAINVIVDDWRKEYDKH